MSEQSAESTTPHGESPDLHEEGDASPEADQEIAASSKRSKRRRPRFLLLQTGAGIVTSTLFSGAIAFMIGVGWHYWVESRSFDLSEVEKLDAGALVLDARGERIGRIGTFDRIVIASDDLPKHFVNALVAAEDQRFHSHMGFDLFGMSRAMVANLRAGTIREGASTLTQQLARNVYPLKGRSMDRKLLEVALAARIESRYSKGEILQHYLNRIYFGSGCYGVGSASRRFFGKEVSELTVAESAMICGIIRSPSRLSPFENPEAAHASRDRTLKRMGQCGMLSPEELARVTGSPTAITGEKADHQHHHQCRYLLARVEKEVRQLLEERPLEGLTIRTSVDLKLQQNGVTNLNRHLAEIVGRFNLSEEKALHLQGAMVVLDNETGDVVVSIGSRDFQRSQYDRAWDLKRPAGSAFFPLVYAAAFEQDGFEEDSPVLDAPVDNREVMVGGVDGVLGEWSTEDETNRWEGKIPAARAFRKSKNSPTVRVGFYAGIDTVREIAADLGVASELRPYPGTFLGASEVRLVELTRAYTAFANAGKPAPRPSVTREITDRQGNTVYSRMTDASLDDARGISGKTAGLLKGMMRLNGNGSGAAVSGKSGTTSDYTDAWFMGFADHHTVGVWVGMDEFNTIADKAFGGDIARPVWDGMVSRVLALEEAESSVAQVEKSSDHREVLRISPAGAVKNFEVAGKAKKEPEPAKAKKTAAIEEGR